MRDDQQTNIIPKKIINATWKVLPGRFLVLGLWVVVFACNQRKDLIDQPLYEGPLSSMDSAVTQMSDSGIVVMQLETALQNNFENGDREWPSGFRINWYNSRGQVTSYFTANYVYFTKAENLYRAEGNVIVKSYANQDELNTEELFWNQTEERFFTDKFVTINSDGEVHTGEGMQSNQDFTEYRILKPKGTFTLEDDPGSPAQRDIPLTPAKQN
ncbi:LPS export ABC transporter periplasmic protein LptC [Ekhidna sp. To15]|uniref:LPS export ABC transporter periplasmic protein LptC n=1 Tax=Ekhidna sp. To15 TaxID=3395267 RepID=UPI003F5279AF